MLLLKRWLVAQEAERQSWSDPTHALKDPDGWLNFIKSSFDLDSRFFDEKIIMEVGCGPYGAIHFVNCSEWFKVGIDPEQYSNIWKKLSIKVPHVVAVGEFLPLRCDVVDVVICFNVLDHVFDPQKVVGEVANVLKKKGILLLWVVTLRSFFRGLSVFLNVIDKPHPYHFRMQEVLNLLEGNDFKVSRVSEKRFQKGRLFANCIKSLLERRFKVAFANFLVFNTYIIAEKR